MAAEGVCLNMRLLSCCLPVTAARGTFVHTSQHRAALPERLCSLAFSLSQVWEREAASPSWLRARDGASLAASSISCSVQVQTSWKKKISAALPSPDDVVLSKPPLFASRVALEKAEPVSLASLGCRWSWWISGPGFFFCCRGCLQPEGRKETPLSPQPLAVGVLLCLPNLSLAEWAEDQRKHWMVLRHGAASWGGEEEV